jgi:hypothetical protein
MDGDLPLEVLLANLPSPGAARSQLGGGVDAALTEFGSTANMKIVTVFSWDPEPPAFVQEATQQKKGRPSAQTLGGESLNAAQPSPTVAGGRAKGTYADPATLSGAPTPVMASDGLSAGQARPKKKSRRDGNNNNDE